MTETERCHECSSLRTCRYCERCCLWICQGCWLSHVGLTKVHQHVG